MRFPIPTRYSAYSALVLRVGLAAVILWFGANQLMSPEMWTAWVPEWTAALGFSPENVVLLNGIFEVAAGALLLLGVLTRWVAILLFLHLLLIVFEIGMTAIGVRDFGLAVAFLALALDDREQKLALAPRT